MKVDTIYHAVVKIDEGDMPRRISYVAKDIKTALNTLATLCNKKTTTELYEFEILEVLGRDSFKRVAMKLPTKAKPHISAKVLSEKIVTGEVVYTPYKLEAA